MDEYPVSVIQRYEKELLSFVENRYSDLLKEIRDKGKMDDDLENRLKSAVEQFKEQFVVHPNS